MLQELRPSLVMLLILSVITGLVYPLLVTGVSQVIMPGKASGSLILRDGKAIGSTLIGQPFADPGHFWSRPSATTPYPYNASSSAGSNLGPLNAALTDAVTARVKALRDADPGNMSPVPVDLVTASGSGLDPHISPAAADYQVARIARVRGVDPRKVRDMVAAATQGRQFGFLGEPRVNVLQLNLALDALPASR